MKPTIHFGRYTGTGLSAPSFVAEVRSWPVDTDLEFTVQRAKVRKTTNQNGYIHVLFTMAARFLNEEGHGTGERWTKDSVKEHCKKEGLYPTKELILPGGVVANVPKSTADLDKYETSETIDRVMVYFAEWGIILPHPGEQQTMNLEQ